MADKKVIDFPNTALNPNFLGLQADPATGALTNFYLREMQPATQTMLPVNVFKWSATTAKNLVDSFTYQFTKPNQLGSSIQIKWRFGGVSAGTNRQIQVNVNSLTNQYTIPSGQSFAFLDMTLIRNDVNSFYWASVFNLTTLAPGYGTLIISPIDFSQPITFSLYITDTLANNTRVTTREVWIRE